MNKNTILVFLLVFLIIGTLVTFTAERSDAQVGSSSGALWGNVTFSNQLYNLIFFDHETGQIYLYSENGKLQEIWVLNQLGKNLVKKYDAREPGVTR